jgi:16S rRNA (guanine527-N7)-methyltransferase
MKTFDRVSLGNTLRTGIEALALNVSDIQCAQLLDYLALLWKWNAVYNLTAVRDPAQMVVQHLLDSLAAVPAFFDAKNILDVGAGGGLPGIVLAIVRPEMGVSLIDTVHKKTAFLTQVKAELGLKNVGVHTMRVEQFQSVEKFDVITSRAFADLSDFITWSQHLLAEGGRFIAMKGVAIQDELAQLSAGWMIREVRPLHVPGMPAQRHLIFIERA